MVHSGVLYISGRRRGPPKVGEPGVAYPPTPPSRRACGSLSTLVAANGSSSEDQSPHTPLSVQRIHTAGHGNFPHYVRTKAQTRFITSTQLGVNVTNDERKAAETTGDGYQTYQQLVCHHVNIQ